MDFSPDRQGILSGTPSSSSASQVKSCRPPHGAGGTQRQSRRRCAEAQGGPVIYSQEESVTGPAREGCLGERRPDNQGFPFSVSVTVSVTV